MKIKISQARKILSNLSKDELEKRGYKTCGRCGGSGNHSYNPIDGTSCFSCNGLGYVKLNNKKPSNGSTVREYMKEGK